LGVTTQLGSDFFFKIGEAGVLFCEFFF
jgi:hypothetical protein